MGETVKERRMSRRQNEQPEEDKQEEEEDEKVATEGEGSVKQTFWVQQQLLPTEPYNSSTYYPYGRVSYNKS